MKFYFTIFSVLFILSCKRSATADNIAKKTDTTIKHTTIDEDWQERGNRLRDTNYQYLGLLLDKVLQTMEQHKHDDLFNGSIDTSAYHFKNMRATFRFGNIFAADKKHLLVKRFINEYEDSQVSLFTDIYILKNNRFKKVVVYTASIGYYEDTTSDINLDGYKDFMVSQYSRAGCCPRDDKIAYLYDHKNGGFMPISLFNAEFDNNNKLVYEMDYGHPGEVTIEKSKWHGISKIKIASISPTHFDNRIDSFVRPYSFTKTIYPSGKITILKDIPRAYKRLKNISYFLLYQQ